jgi:hypothetical protein
MQNQVARENELALLCSGVVGGRIVGVLVAKLRPENKRGSNPVAPSNQVRGSDRSREASSSGSCGFFLCSRPVDPVGFSKRLKNPPELFCAPITELESAVVSGAERLSGAFVWPSTPPP